MVGRKKVGTGTTKGASGHWSLDSLQSCRVPRFSQNGPPSLALNGRNCSLELWCANDAMKKKSNDESRKRIVKQESVASLGTEFRLRKE